ncbi:heat stress transcription factor B-4-like protein [Tanacetum coccineum]
MAEMFTETILRDYVVELQSTNPNTIIKITVEGNTDPFLPTRVFQRIHVCLGALKFGLRACRRNLLGLDGSFMKGPFPSQVLAAVGLDSNNGIYPLVYALVEPESKSSWCWFLQCLGDDIDLHPNSNFTFISDRQKDIVPAIKTVDMLWRAASPSVKEFEKCMLELKTMNPKAHEWLHKIPPEHWARSHFSGRAKYDLLLNNICEVFNRKWELTGIPCKHVVAACWNMALNDRAAPPPEAWVNPCYWLTTWRETYSHKVQPISGTKYWEKSTCPTTLLPPKHHVQVGRPRKKRKRSKHEDEPFVKDGKLSRKGRTITCQSCGNTWHNKATCKGQGRKATTGGNNAEASGSASRQAQQTEPAIGQDGSCGSGAGIVIVCLLLLVNVVQVLAVKVHLILDGQREEYKQKKLVHKKELPLNLQVNLLSVLKCQ